MSAAGNAFAYWERLHALGSGNLQPDAASIAALVILVASADSGFQHFLASHQRRRCSLNRNSCTMFSFLALGNVMGILRFDSHDASRQGSHELPGRQDRFP